MQCQPQAVRPTAGRQCAQQSSVEMLRAQVCSNDELSFLMEAHDGLSATIAQRSGFKGSGRLACRLPARSAIAMPMKLHGPSSSRASNA